MVKPTGQGMEALAVRRAAMADGDKVRYRVYTSSTEFIAVIAESALMALRVSGVPEPHRIVRDLPTEGVAIAAERMEADSGQRVNLATEKVPSAKAVVAAMPKAAEPQNANFLPLKLGDLDQKRSRTTRILSAKDLEALTSQSAKPAAAAPEPELQPAAEPVAEMAPPPVPEPAEPEELSPEQVQALLNE